MEAEEEGGKPKLHIAVFPCLPFGHLSPFLEFSNRIAQLGHRVSFLIAPSTIQTLSLPGLSSISPNLHFIPLINLPSHPISILNKAYDSLAGDLTGFLQSASPPVNWLLHDFSPYWSPLIAKTLNIRTVFLCPLNAATLSFLGPPEYLSSDHSSHSSPHMILSRKPDWIPFDTKVFYKPFEARLIYDAMYLPDNSGVSPNFRLGSSLAAADVVAVRSCFELEHEYLPVLEKLYCKPVIPAGHFPSSVLLQKENGGQDELFQWLDKQEKRSVVYVAFGSELHLKKEEVSELARGLEMSKLPFVWAYRSGGEELLPLGFEERVEGRGVVCKGWVPQMKLLGHEAIGGFLTHCGWNSLVEALGTGVALVLLPMLYDQGLNARLMEEKKVGVEVERREEDGGFDGEGVARVLRLVMVEKEGEEVRVRAREMGRALGMKEMHDGYVERFVEFLEKY
ncbi:putative soyasaponin III rhamnosyltransferase [Dioscorea sansibarensis]